ncbi:ABC transporter permease subunit [Spiroplasma endosymbiont of Amphimallon solstitiale]|uniref:ABC transporter permease subunit n=1 Tax=Spiroplasma endosymbiont of Amphimallon solstitiale TaxID=3066288 RepID=UPI00313E2043
MFKQKTWFLKRRSRLYLGSKEMNSSLTKFKGSIFAIIFGLIIACFVIIGSGQNAFTYFQLLLTYAFTSWPANNWDNTLVWWAIYIVAGLALVISFRSGMFNIGVAGQMLAAGAVVIAIGVRYDLSQPLAIISALFAGVLAAILVALVTVLLKVFFNVHEVVTSILLNWTIWYLVKWLFKINKDLYDADHGTSASIHDSMSMSINGYNCILPLLISIILIITVWFLLKKTTLGYKIRTVGLNPFAAVYSGINHKHYCITSFVISGALAGVMAVIYYIAKNPSISFLTDDLPTIGFDSIAVALVGQINPIGVVGSAFLWGLIKSGGSIGSVLTLPTATGDIIFGVIIYSAACAVLLSRLQPIKFLIRYLNIAFDGEKRKVTNSFIAKMYYHFIENFKIKRQYNKLKSDLIKEKNNKINHLKIEYNKSLSDYESKVKNLKQNLSQEINKLKQELSDQLKSLKNQLVKTNDKKLKEQLILKKCQLQITYKIEIKELIKKYKIDKEQLKGKYNKSLSDYESKVKNLKQNLSQEINKLKQELSDQLKSLKNQLVKTNDKKLKEQLILKKCQLQITYKIEIKELIKKYKIDKEQLKGKYNKSLSDYESKVKNLKQNLSQEINKLKQELSDQLKSLKNQLVKTNDKKLKEQLILKKCQLQITYKIDKEQLKGKYNKILWDDKSVVKNLKQNLSQEINKVNSDINLQLQAVINNKNDKVDVNWAQFFQENKALNHYIYKQYNAIWKKGKIGNWNNFQQEIKTIYGESLNMYINEKMKYENNVYNYKQDLIREIVLLKKQKAILDKSRVKDLKLNLYREINKLKQELSDELKSLKNQTVKTDDKKIKKQLILAKHQLQTNYKNNVKELIKNYKIDKQQLKSQIIPINSNINILTKQFIKKAEIEKTTFINKFTDIFKNEQQAIMKIKTERTGGKS